MRSRPVLISMLLLCVSTTASAQLVEPPADTLRQRQDECGIPFWPHGFVTAHCDMDELVEAWTNEYACLGYGTHLYDDLVAFGELMNIRTLGL